MHKFEVAEFEKKESQKAGPHPEMTISNYFPPVAATSMAMQIATNALDLSDQKMRY